LRPAGRVSTIDRLAAALETATDGGYQVAGKAIEITDESFESAVLQADKPVLIDFWAVWCGPCRMVAPVVEELAGELEDKLTVGKLDVDNNREVATRYGIQSIPTLMLFKGGEMVERIIGAVDKRTLMGRIESFL
jgi:thioredoxin 1